MATTDTFANREDLDEMLQSAGLNQSLHCLLRQKRSSKKEMQF